MNALDLLKQDHQEAMNLIEQIEDAGTTAGAAKKKDLFQRLKSALKLHTAIEEEIFYPAMEAFDDTRDMIEVAYQEHEAVDQLLAEMSALPPNDEMFHDKLAELRDNIENHVEEEEGELFPKAEELCGESRLREMGRQIEQRKQQRSVAASQRK